jgi:hypothetical protein
MDWPLGHTPRSELGGSLAPGRGHLKPEFQISVQLDAPSRLPVPQATRGHGGPAGYTIQLSPSPQRASPARRTGAVASGTGTVAAGVMPSASWRVLAAQPQPQATAQALNLKWYTFRLTILLLGVVAGVVADVPPTHRSALADLYTSTNGTGWTVSTNWLSGDPCSGLWYRVGCSGTTAVTYVRHSGWQAEAGCNPPPSPRATGTAQQFFLRLTR